MSQERRLAPLVMGLAMVGLGSLFLSSNFFDFNIRWLDWLRFVVPVLLICWGSFKLIRHFLWDPSDSGAKGRPGLLSGLFWTGLGVAIFLDLLKQAEFLEFVGLYWPIVMVLFGIGKIIDYYRLQGRMQFRAIELVGIIFIGLLGVLMSQAAKAHFGEINLPWDVMSIGERSTRHTETVEESVSARGLQRVEISNIYGDVTVESGPAESVEIRLSKEFRAKTEDREKALERNKRVKITTQSQDGLLRIGTNRARVGRSGARFKSHLYVTVPREFQVNVRNKYGRVKVERINGRCDVTNRLGSVSLNEIVGDVVVINERGATTLRHIQGLVKVENQRGSVRVEEVTGAVEAGTTFKTLTVRKLKGRLLAINEFGKVRVSDIQGNVTINAPGSEVSATGVNEDLKIQNSNQSVSVRNSRSLELETQSPGRVEIRGLTGPINISAQQALIDGRDLSAQVTVLAKASRVRLSRLQGPFKVATSLRSVKIEDFLQGGEIQNEFGEVSLTTGSGLRGAITVSNKNGAISLALPAETAFRLSALALGGSVKSDFGETSETEGDQGHSLETSVGQGGPLIRLQTTNSQIRIRRR